MAQLRQDYSKFVERGAEIVVVGPEGREAFQHQWKQQAYPFVGLPDPDQRVANLYGQEVKVFKMGRMPAMMVIDKLGRIRYQHYGDSMSDIPANRDILTLIDKINQEIVE